MDKTKLLKIQKNRPKTKPRIRYSTRSHEHHQIEVLFRRSHPGNQVGLGLGIHEKGYESDEPGIKEEKAPEVDLMTFDPLPALPLPSHRRKRILSSTVKAFANNLLKHSAAAAAAAAGSQDKNQTAYGVGNGKQQWYKMLVKKSSTTNTSTPIASRVNSRTRTVSKPELPKGITEEDLDILVSSKIQMYKNSSFEPPPSTTKNNSVSFTLNPDMYKVVNAVGRSEDSLRKIESTSRSILNQKPTFCDDDDDDEEGEGSYIDHSAPEPIGSSAGLSACTSTSGLPQDENEAGPSKSYEEEKDQGQLSSEGSGLPVESSLTSSATASDDELDDGPRKVVFPRLEDLTIPLPHVVAQTVDRELIPLIALDWKKDCRTWLWKSAAQRERALAAQNGNSVMGSSESGEEAQN